MPNALDITLHASGAETAGGNSASVDVGDRSLLVLTVDVTAVSGTTPVLGLSVQTSTSTAWELSLRLNPIKTVGSLQVVVPVNKRNVRLSWTTQGTTPSFTFAVTGQAHQLYCTPGDLTTWGIPGTALEGITPDQRSMACLSASDEAAGHIGMAYTLPLTKWDTDLRRQCACMAVFHLLGSKGFEPASGKDTLIESRYEAALAWLKRIADGKLRPPGIADSTPLQRETEVYVVSQAGRGWG